MNFEEFKKNVENWAEVRNIYKYSTAEAQLMKALSELGEVADAIIKNDRDALKDGIGDLAVCYVNYAKMCGLDIKFSQIYFDEKNNEIVSYASLDIGLRLASNIVDDAEISLYMLQKLAELHGFDFMDCCEAAWNEIKDRKGFMSSSGAFVKEE